MLNNEIPILSTRNLNSELIKRAEERNIIITEVPFIIIESINSVEVQQEIEAAYILDTNIIFTSKNAVDAVGACLDIFPSWKIYCIGHATRDHVIAYFGEEYIAGIADYGDDLAELIIADDVQDAIFFCGNKRRDVLPDKLAKAGINVQEIVVYQNLTNEVKIDKEYFGVLFFSPSAVESFFAKNKIGNAVAFAIGNTTAEAISLHTNNKIIISPSPDPELMLDLVIEYFGG